MIDRVQNLEEEVWTYVQTLRDSPEARLKSREAFYKKFGQEDSSQKYGYGDSEIAFLGWEERGGVLRPADAHPPGSAWWSNVNLWFIYLSELGGRAYEVGYPKSQLPVPSQFWITFIEQPSPLAWYRAHNSSIIDGYLKFPHLATKEIMPERLFINMVLYRLLYAQSMVEGDFFLPRLGEILGDPRGGAVQFITHLDPYYPSRYPMTKKDIREVLGKVHNLAALGVKFLDDVLIEPELTQLYHLAAGWNKQPRLISLLTNHKPSYPDGEHFPKLQQGCIISVLAWIRRLFLKK